MSPFINGALLKKTHKGNQLQTQYFDQKHVFILHCMMQRSMAYKMLVVLQKYERNVIKLNILDYMNISLHHWSCSCSFFCVKRYILTGLKLAFCMLAFVKCISIRPLTVSVCRCGFCNQKDLFHLGLCVIYDLYVGDMRADLHLPITSLFLPPNK